jgi:drug/metabolite transporter (DMT)-like permease
MMSERTLGILFALATAAFWGVYGPALGFARSNASPPLWSPFKPYVFIGVAYLVWGVIGGLLAMRLIPSRPDSTSFTGIYLPAMKWGFIAGSLGAFGALTLTMAMFKAKNAGLVMPIVFGGAVSITAITNIVLRKVLEHQATPTDPRLWIGMALVAAGIVMVAMYTPHFAPQAHPPKTTTAAPAPPTHAT